jgi:hypothetical protein
MKILVNGCSYVAGQGLDHWYHDENNFVNVFLTNIFPGCEIYNIAIPGSSNKKIFENTVSKLSEEKFDLVFVGWTSYPRHHFYFGLELFDYLGHFFNPSNQGKHDTWKHLKKQNLEITNQILCMIHDHYEILDILRYSRTLKNLHTQTYFLNILAHWSENFFSRKSWQKPSELDEYTQKLLDVDNRTDEQIAELYDKQHRDYERITTPGFWNNWLNLYQPVRNFRVDTGNDGSHPGPLTHINFAKFLISQWQTRQ